MPRQLDMPTHGTTGSYKAGCRCDECRGAHNRRMREYSARRRAEGRPLHASKRAVGRECARCGMQFAARLDAVKAGYGRYCSQRCNRLSMTDLRAGNPIGTSRPRAPRKSAVRKRAEKSAARSAQGTTGGGRVWIQGACLICGTDFLSAGAASRYCSRECRAQARRRRGWISYPDRLAIYVRDDYSCHICGESTSKDYDCSDPWSPTLDHLVPRALGGGDEPSNLAVAHLWCNSVRGDLTHFTDGDLAEV